MDDGSGRGVCMQMQVYLVSAPIGWFYLAGGDTGGRGGGGGGGGRAAVRVLRLSRGR